MLQPFAPRSYAPRHGYPTRKGPSGVLPFNVLPYIGLVDLLRTLSPFDRLTEKWGQCLSYHMLSGSYFDYRAVLRGLPRLLISMRTLLCCCQSKGRGHLSVYCILQINSLTQFLLLDLRFHIAAWKVHLCILMEQWRPSHRAPGCILLYYVVRPLFSYFFLINSFSSFCSPLSHPILGVGLVNSSQSQTKSTVANLNEIKLH